MASICKEKSSDFTWIQLKHFSIVTGELGLQARVVSECAGMVESLSCSECQDRASISVSFSCPSFEILTARLFTMPIQFYITKPGHDIFIDDSPTASI
jgi:hypothetical protein